jgi:GT2 family glycosyltransferase
MTAAPLVTVIIVNFNGGEMVLACLRALRTQTFQDFVTVVVDNNSTDDSADAIEREDPGVVVYRLQSNTGFAGGVNHALRERELGSWVALLNPDAYPDATWLQELVTHAERNPAFASFGSKMFSDLEREHLDGVGDTYHVSGLPRRRGHGQRDVGQFDGNAEIFGPCAAAGLYSTGALSAVCDDDGCVLDEDFFCYVEDVDLAFRLRLAGYRSMYVSSALVQHVGSGVVGKHSNFQLYHGHRNLVWAYVKNMPGALFWIMLPLHVALNVFTILWYSMRGKGQPVIQAKRDAMAGMAQCLKKRRHIQATRQVSVFEVLRQLNWLPSR